jgi:hypothetical protein
LGAEAGVAFVLLALLALFIPGKAPDQNATGQQLISYISGHRDGLLWSTVLWSLATVCGLFFVATLRARLSEAEGGHGELATAAAVGGVFVFMANWAGSMLFLGATYRENIGLAPSTVRAAFDMYGLAGIASNVGVAVLAGSVAAVVLSTGLLPKWVGWFSGIVAALCVASLFGVLATSGAFAPGGVFQIATMMAGIVLVLAVAVEFMVHAGAPITAPAPQGAAITA